MEASKMAGEKFARLVEILDVLHKVKEEVAELEEAIQKKKKEEISDEIGDVLFSLANLSRHFDVNPEIALRKTNQKFIRRFQFIEAMLKQKGKELREASLIRSKKRWLSSRKLSKKRKKKKYLMKSGMSSFPWPICPATLM